MLALCGAWLLSSLCPGGTTAAQAPDTSLDSPAILALLHPPEMQKAIATGRAGDNRSALAFLRAAAPARKRSGANRTCRSLFRGQKCREKLRQVDEITRPAPVLARQEPTASIAAVPLNRMRRQLHDYGSKEQTVLMAADMKNTLANPFA